MGAREGAVMGLESQAVSARVTKHFVTFLVKHVINDLNISTRVMIPNEISGNLMHLI